MLEHDTWLSWRRRPRQIAPLHSTGPRTVHPLANRRRRHFDGDIPYLLLNVLAEGGFGVVAHVAGYRRSTVSVVYWSKSEAQSSRTCVMYAAGVCRTVLTNLSENAERER